MKPFLVIKTGQTYPGIRDRHGCFEDWIAAGLGIGPEHLRIANVAAGEPLPAQPETHCGIVITGSPAMVTDREPWSEALAAWLVAHWQQRASEVPLLGICYGHQLIAHALGGRVGYNPRGREIGTVQLHNTAAAHADPLLGALAFPLTAHVTHLQSVLELPPGAVHLASSALEPHHAFRIGARIWGLQFHPEFTADIMRAYLDLLATRLTEEGLDAAAVAAAVTDAAPAADVLRRFAALAREPLARPDAYASTLEPPSPAA